MDERRQQVRRKQRDAIWKWRWLGLRESTPGFKGSMIVLAAVAAFVVMRVLTAL